MRTLYDDEQLIKAALNSLGEHWDSVLILCCRPSEDGGKTTDFTANHSGNAFAATRQAEEYVIHQNEITRLLAKKRHEESQDNLS